MISKVKAVYKKIKRIMMMIGKNNYQGMSKNNFNLLSDIYSEKNLPIAIIEVNSIKLNHVMANSKKLLNKTHYSVIKLGNCDMEKLKDAVKHAKSDFRDVIVWASKL